MFHSPQIRRSIPISAVILAVLFSLDLLGDLAANWRQREDLERAVVVAQAQARVPLAVEGGIPMPPPPKNAQVETPDHSLEIAALGAQLKVVNEASWNMVFKFCFIWFFTLATVLAYRIIDRRWS